MARPPEFETPDELEKVFEKYIQSRIDPEKKVNFVSITDFCYFADIGQSTFYDYGKKPGFRTIIKRIQQFVFAKWEKQLFMPGRNTTGAIFWLKNFAGMADKQEVQHNVSGQIEHTKKLQKLPDGQLQQLNQLADAIDVTPEKEEAQNDSD